MPRREATPAKPFQKIPSIFWNIRLSPEFLADFLHKGSSLSAEGTTSGFYMGLVRTLALGTPSSVHRSFSLNRQQNPERLCCESAAGDHTGLWGLSLLALGHFKVHECPESPSPRPGVGGGLPGFGVQSAIPTATIDHSQRTGSQKSKGKRLPGQSLGEPGTSCQDSFPGGVAQGYAEFLQQPPVTAGVKCRSPGKPRRDFMLRVHTGGLVSHLLPGISTQIPGFQKESKCLLSTILFGLTVRAQGTMLIT